MFYLFSFEHLVGSSFIQESLSISFSISHRLPPPWVLASPRIHESSPSTDHMVPSLPLSCDGASNSGFSMSLAAPLPNLESLFVPHSLLSTTFLREPGMLWASLVSNLCTDISRDPSCLSTWCPS